MKPFTVRDVARAVLGHDDCPGVRLPMLETVTQIALQAVLGRNAAFSDDGVCAVDLGNGFVLHCTVRPVELSA